MLRTAAIIACCLAAACGGACAYPENYASDRLGARVITLAELDGKRKPDMLLSDAPIPKGQIAFAPVEQSQVLTVDLGDERIFDRIDFGTDNPNSERNAKRIRIEVSRESLQGPYQPIFEKAGLGYFQALRIPKVRARWVRFDFGDGSEGVLVHSVRVYKSYEHPRSSEVTRLLSERISPQVAGLEAFYRAADAHDWNLACATLRTYCAEKHPVQYGPDPNLDLSRADALASGSLDFGGISRREVVPVDWAYLMTEGWLEHRSLLNRGECIATAADACCETRDVKRARHLKSIFYDWIDANPKPSVISGDDYPTWRSSDAAARARVLISRFAKVTADRNIDDEMWANWLYAIWEHADYLASDTTSVGESLASAIAAVVSTANEFSFFNKQQDWITYAQQNLERMVIRDVATDGKIVDDSPGWVALAYSSMNSALAGLEKAGSKIAPSVRERVGKMPDFLAAITKPDGGMPTIGECSPGGDVTQPARATSSASFPLGGWSVMRAACDRNPRKDERQLILKASRGPHSHSDALAVTLHACGRELLVDEGGDSHTASHNTTCIDGEDQPSLGGRVDRWFSNAGVDWAVASHHAYKNLTAIRNIVFIRPDYWILCDEVESETEGSHTCDQNWWLPSDAGLVEDQSTKAIHTSYPSGGNLSIVPTGTEGLMSEATGDGDAPARGWRYRRTGAAPVLIDVALCPYDGSQPPRMSVQRLAAEGSPVGVMAWKVVTPEGVDYIIASRKGAQVVSIPSEQIKVEAEVMVIRTRAGRAARVSGGAVRSIVFGGVTLFSQELPVGNFDMAL